MSKSPLSQLASISEGMIGKATNHPTAARLLQTGQQLIDRVDDLSKRVRGLEAMEKQHRRARGARRRSSSRSAGASPPSPRPTSGDAQA